MLQSLSTRKIELSEESEVVLLRGLYPNFALVEPFARSENATYVGGFLGSRLVGGVFLLQSNGLWIVEAIFVLPEFRRQHIAANIVNCTKEFLREMNIKRLYCLIRNNNVASLSLVDRFGVKPDPERNRKEPFDDRTWFSVWVE